MDSGGLMIDKILADADFQFLPWMGGYPPSPNIKIIAVASV